MKATSLQKQNLQLCTFLLYSSLCSIYEQTCFAGSNLFVSRLNRNQFCALVYYFLTQSFCSSSKFWLPLHTTIPFTNYVISKHRKQKINCNYFYYFLVTQLSILNSIPTKLTPTFHLSIFLFHP